MAQALPEQRWHSTLSRSQLTRRRRKTQTWRAGYVAAGGGNWTPPPPPPPPGLHFAPPELYGGEMDPTHVLREIVSNLQLTHGEVKHDSFADFLDDKGGTNSDDGSSDDGFYAQSDDTGGTDLYGDAEDDVDEENAGTGRGACSWRCTEGVTPVRKSPAAACRRESWQQEMQDYLALAHRKGSVLRLKEICAKYPEFEDDVDEFLSQPLPIFSEYWNFAALMDNLFSAKEKACPVRPAVITIGDLVDAIHHKGYDFEGAKQYLCHSVFRNSFIVDEKGAIMRAAERETPKPAETVQILEEEEVPFADFMVSHFDKMIAYDTRKFLNRASGPWFHTRLFRSSRMPYLWPQPSQQKEEWLSSMD